MRRLERIDWLLLLGLTPLWLAALPLHVKEIARTGNALVPVFASPSWGENPYPTVGGLRLERDTGGTGLEVGDRLLRVGDRDLAGAGFFGFDALAFEEAGASLRVPLVFERDGERRETELTLRPAESPWSRLPFCLSFGAIALLILLRAPPTRANRFFFAGFMSFAIFETAFEGGSAAQTYAAYAVFYLLGPVAVFCLLRWLREFPEEVAERDRPSAAWCWLALLFPLARASYVFGGPLPTELAPQAVILSDVVLFLTAAGILTRNTWKAPPVGRRRVKWVLCGAYLALLPVLIGLLEPFLGFDFARFDQIIYFGLLMSWTLPAGILIAVLRYQLFDIDRVLGTTVTVSALVAVLIGAAATIVPPIAREVGSLLGFAPKSGQVALSALLAAAAVPTHQWLRPQIDRLLFVDRYRLEQGIGELLPALSDCADAATLIRTVGSELDALLNPRGCVVYLSDGEGYAPVFSEGREAPPHLEETSPLIGALRDERGPVTLDAGRHAGTSSPLGPFQRAALESLEAAAIVPIRRPDKLLGLLCLGAKRSRDVYTPTDLSFLTAVAEKVSAELLRFEQEAEIREGIAMQDALRRYVPGAVAQELASGTEIESGEQEVSVLFVDIRGYTSFSQSREAEEIFSTINRYTETVSRVVRHHGGSVVEFNGDGMMAVFGAPRMLDEKEGAAVSAGLEIVDAVALLGVDSGTGLAVGVGVATGPAFVGNIQAVDRMIWSAIGNTTNLAARLEALTRDLEAAMVIDEATRRGAGDRAASFEKREQVAVRGRSEPFDVYAMPLSS